MSWAKSAPFLVLSSAILRLWNRLNSVLPRTIYRFDAARIGSETAAACRVNTRNFNVFELLMKLANNRLRSSSL